MPPSIFQQSVTGHQSMFPGTSISMSPNLNGIPGMEGPTGAMMQMILEPMLQDMLGTNGFMPGQFRPTHNLFDHHRRRMQFQQMQQVITESSRTDQAAYVRMMRGMASSAGIGWTDERERAARMMASDMGQIAPMLAQQMPHLFDQMHGVRGSATVLSQRMFEGGRYRVDPVTGLLGTSAESTSAMSRQVYERLYGPGADLSLMRGVGAGSAGQLFDELSRRGGLPRVLSRDEQMRGMATAEGERRGFGPDRIRAEMGTLMDELRGLTSPQLENRMRQFEADRISSSLRTMSGAVSAMRDIFGDMGRPDAPMSEIIEGLQVLTQGGLSQLDPSRIEQIVRDTHNLARRSGIGMDNMMTMMGAASNRAESMGLNRVFGVTAAHGAASFSTAYSNMAGGPAWGRGDRDRMMAVDQQLRLNAANSPVANQLAATMRLGTDVRFREGSEGEAIFQALTRGDTVYRYGNQDRSVHVDRGRWQTIMQDSGVNAGLASAYRSQTQYNQRYVSENNLTDVARQLQGRVDIAPRLQRAYETAGRQAGITDQALLSQIGQTVSEGLLGDIPPEDWQNPDAMARHMATRLNINPNDQARMQQLRQVATLGWGNGEQMVRTNRRLRGYGSFDQLVQAGRSRTLAAASDHMQQAQMETRMQSAMAGLGQGSPLSRLADALMEAGPGTGIADLMRSTLNWVPDGVIGERLQGTLAQFQAEMDVFQNADPERIRAQAQDLQRNGNRDGLQQLAERYTGGNVDTLLNGRDLRRTIREQAIRRVQALSPVLRRQAEEAGLETGARVGEQDVRRVTEGFRDRRPGAVRESDDLAERILNDDRSIAALGPGGLETVRRIQGRNEELRRLAGEHAGGNLGVLMATESQRRRASEAHREVESLSARSRGLTEQIEAAERAGDRPRANTLRTELEGINRNLRERQTQLDEVNREAGTTGSDLARATPVSDAVRARVSRVRTDQENELHTVRDRLRTPLRRDMTAAEREQLTRERQMRGRTGTEVMSEIFRQLGVNAADVSEADRTALAREVQGDRGTELRRSAAALGRLRDITRARGLTSGEDFQRYLQNGPGADATDEEKALFNRVTAGRGRGQGLAGINRDNLRRESVLARLRQFAPWEREAPGGPGGPPGAPGEGGAGGGSTMRVEITSGSITIPGLGTGSFRATGRGGVR